MKRKKKAALLCAAGALGVILAACGNQSPLDPKNPTKITIWTYYNGDQLSALDSLVAEFNETVGAQEGIIVKSVSQGSVNDLETNVIAAVQGEVGADEVPNIFMAYADTAYEIDQMGQAVDLKDYLSEEEKRAYVDSYMQEGDFAGTGEIKIFPTAKSLELLVINKTDWDVFAEATGASYDDLSDMESLTATAAKYFEWTDAQTPDVPDDGKALFGRDAMANYMLIGSLQLGQEIFEVEDQKMTLHFDKDIARKLWDNYYIPFVKGHFAATGRFRSDDIKTGNIICYVGSSSGASFFPDSVSISDAQSYPIEMDVLPCPKFSGGDYAVQQGAGMVVTKGEEAEVYASVEFLKWFTADERNIKFSVDSGYLPVTKTANTLDAILGSGTQIRDDMQKILTAGVETVNANELYTTRAFEGGGRARTVLEYAMSDKAVADRETVVTKMAQGQSLEQAVAAFETDANFNIWYEETLQRLQEFAQ
ncbi:MAG: extracellular solute-binding protein [Bacteroidales bacterium]|nr:extracellular solute-binding protein [Bacteroidales bacterium]MCM1414786.1 extracellular solute-binding protein [bacterium]MCM1423208.1 extracellular solute-binding protein [bacterium]